VTGRLALRVMQVGAVAAVLVALPYKAFDLDRYFVPKELVVAITATVAVVAVLASARRIALTRVDTLLVAFLALSAVSAAGAANGWLAWRALAVSVAGIGLFWVARALTTAGMGRAVLTGVALAVVVAAATSLLQAYGLSSDLFSLNRAPGGTLGNRNFIAHEIAAGLPALVYLAIGTRRPTRFVLAAIGLTLLTWALVLSRSRAAWLAVGVALLLTTFIVLRAPGKWGGASIGWRVIVLAGCAAAGTVAAVALPNVLHWKSASPYLDSALGVADYREGSGHGRLVQYANTARMAVAHPLLGVGPGNWAVVYPKFASPHDPSLSEDDGMTANPWPSSDWAAFVSERGALTTACLALALLGLVVSAFGTGIHGVALLATVIAVALTGAFDAVLLLPAPAAVIWPALGALAAPATAKVVLPFPRIARVVAAVFVVLLGTVAIWRSASQAVAMGLYGDGTRATALTYASEIDPGSYRIHERLAEVDINRGRCAGVRTHAGAAHHLFPNAPAPKHLLAECPKR
jgi:hypothetical protein